MIRFFPKFQEFEQQHKNSDAQLIWAKLPADLETPVSAMLKLKQEQYCGLFESVEGGVNRARYSFIVLSPDIVWKYVNGKASVCTDIKEGKFTFVKKTDVFASLRDLISQSKLDIPEGLPPMSAGIFGYMGYDMVRLMENLPDSNEDILSVPDSIFIRPQIVVIFDSVKDEIIIATPLFKVKKTNSISWDWDSACERIQKVVRKLNKPLHASYDVPDSATTTKQIEGKSNITKEDYYSMVEKAKKYIYEGDIFQVVLSQRFEVDFPYSSFSLYRALRRLNPSPFSFWLKFDDFALVGSSPEILVRLTNKIVTVRPIAGTRKRGKNKAEDEAFVKDLLSDGKELAEHLMLLDLGRNDVGRVAQFNTVRVTEQKSIEFYSHVMHIVSNVEGRIEDKYDAVDALIAGFPAGTVSGAPKVRAMEIIEELEHDKRNFYAGCVGYFSANGDMDTCITLRTALLRNGRLYVQAGGGIVADSNPEAEYEECRNKAGAIFAAAKEAANYEEQSLELTRAKN